MYWIYCLVARQKNGELWTFHNETPDWTLRPLSWERHTEAWLFEVPVDGEDEATPMYYISPAEQVWQPGPERIPEKVSALLRCTGVKQHLPAD